MPVTMYHNHRCNTSRRTLALLREKGVEPNIIEYLKTPPSAGELKKNPRPAENAGEQARAEEGGDRCRH